LTDISHTFLQNGTYANVSCKITVELALEIHYLYIYLHMNTAKNLTFIRFPIISSTLFQTDTNAPVYVYTKQYNRTALCISIMYH